MTRQPARVLEDKDVCRLLKHITHTRYPKRNRAIILLSFKAGLRACEISGLTWPMVLSSRNRAAASLTLTGSITKGGKRRVIPAHPDLQKALGRLHKIQGRPIEGPVIDSERYLGGEIAPHMSAGSIVNWFSSIYAELGLNGCSSHSGRRTFITNAARALSRTGGSLRDVQELAGHRALTTTERYIEGDRAAQRKLVSLI